MELKVIKSYATKYNDPIVLTKGDIVKLGEEEKQDKWLGWIRATSGDKSGWIPKDIIGSRDDISGIISESYSAKELNVNIGEVVILVSELNGWVWVRNSATGEEGWIPKENIESM